MLEQTTMFPYWNSKIGVINYTPNSVFAMCRKRGAHIILANIPVTWKSYKF